MLGVALPECQYKNIDKRLTISNPIAKLLAVETHTIARELVDDCSYALVGFPERKYLWILSRSRCVDAPRFERLMAISREQGFDVARIQRTSPAGDSLQ
jgi:apolipoprotein D and lipocalin family protein